MNPCRPILLRMAGADCIVIHEIMSRLISDANEGVHDLPHMLLHDREAFRISDIHPYFEILLLRIDMTQPALLHRSRIDADEERA